MPAPPAPTLDEVAAGDGGGGSRSDLSPSTAFPATRKKGRPPCTHGGDEVLATPTTAETSGGGGAPTTAETTGQVISEDVFFTPVVSVVTIEAGEDVAENIMALSREGASGFSILSAAGAVSTVTLRDKSTSRKAMIFEGRFEIVSLSGTFMVTGDGGGSSAGESGGLQIVVTGDRGQLMGGITCGALTAATPVNVAVSFLSDFSKLIK